MGGAPVSVKYVIKARMEVSGLVEKHDIIGAIFGQTEGLLGEQLDLRELQKMGRLGRIEVKAKRVDGKTVAEIEIPSNLDKVETALVAAAIESVDRVGPYQAKTQVTEIVDVRVERRKKIVERAVELLKMLDQAVPETKELLDEVLEKVRKGEITTYGPEKLPAGPEVETSDTVIIVEGRADVLNLLKHGYRNVVALGGASVPKSIIDLARKKKTILFIDGDRGGELIAKNLLSMTEIDFVARAPQGREVEELTGKEIAKALQNKIPAKEFVKLLEKEKQERKTPKDVKMQVIVAPEKVKQTAASGSASAAETVEVPAHVAKAIEELRGTLEAILYDEEWREIERLPVRDLASRLQEIDGVSYIVFDGIITQRLVDLAFTKGVKMIIGARVGDIVRRPAELKIASFDDVKAA